MAAADITRQGLFNQKRSVCVAYFEGIAEADVLVDGSVLANLPANVLVTAVRAVVTTKSDTASSNVKIMVGAATLVTAISVTTATVVVGTVIGTAAKLATGGELKIVPGSTTPAAGTLVMDLEVEYIEVDKVTGEYTN